MKKKLLIAVIIVLIIAVVSFLILKGNTKTQDESAEITVAPTTAISSPEQSSDVQEKAADEAVAGEIPEVGNSNNALSEWSAEGEAIPEVTPEPKTQVSQDFATGENETERVPISSISE